MWPLSGLVVAALLGPAAAGAADIADLDVNLPTNLDDAFADEPGSIELQGSVQYDRRNGRDTVRLLPRLQLGIADRLQVSAALPYNVGSGRDRNQGDAGVGALYNLNRETAWLPAFALAGDVSTPIGPGDRGPETVLTFIATKTIDPAASRRLHLNAAWLRNLDPGGDERRNRYRVVLGYSQLVASDLAVVLDYVREGQGRGEGAANVFEAGLHYQAGERVRLGIGAGVGVGRDSPRLRALLSVQVELGRR